MIMPLKKILLICTFTSAIAATDVPIFEMGLEEFPYIRLARCSAAIELRLHSKYTDNIISTTQIATGLSKGYAADKIRDGIVRRFHMEYPAEYLPRLRQYFESDLYQKVIAGQKNYFDICFNQQNPFAIELSKSRLLQCNQLYARLRLAEYAPLIFSSNRILTRHRFLNKVVHPGLYPEDEKKITEIRDAQLLAERKGFEEKAMPWYTIVPFCGQFSGLNDKEFAELFEFAIEPWYFYYAKGIYLGAAEGIWESQRAVILEE
jgi:hypothetical protein